MMKPKQKRLYVKRQKALAETVKTVVAKEAVAVEEKTVAIEEVEVTEKKKTAKPRWSRKKKDD